MSSAALMDADRSHLLVIDIQERFARAVPEAEFQHCVSGSQLLIQGANLLDVPVTVTEQYPTGLGHTVNALAAQLHSDTPVLAKTCFSSCGADGFNSRLTGDHNDIIVCGLEAHVCVLQTSMELLVQGYRVYLVEDAICARHADDMRLALQRLRDAGAVLVSVECVLFEWLRDARHTHFKTLANLVRERTRG